MDTTNIIVIGASAGGFQGMTKLVSSLSADMNAAVFGVLHLSKDSAPDIIVQHIQAVTKLVCKIPNNQEPIKAGHFYFAPSDHHMMVSKGIIYINKGPHENRWRPSIDVLFRSAAANYDSHVIGIILSGMLDDGTSGMSAIKRCGGICIVQEPTEADFPDMPNSVIDNVNIDHQVPIADMHYIIEDILSKPGSGSKPIPADVQLEADITMRMNVDMNDLKKIATHSVFTCPDCGGGLWHINDDAVHRYRCHTGHVYNEDVLEKKLVESLEESLWVSIRMLEERRNLLLTIAKHEHDKGHIANGTESQKRADEVGVHIQRLKSLLSSVDATDKINE